MQFAYKNLSWFIKPLLYEVCDFDRQQKKVIDEELRNYLAWNRKEMLPRYVEFLRKVSARIEGLPQPGKTIPLFKANDPLKAEALALYHESLAPTIAPTVRVLRTLSPRQVEQLKSFFAANNDKRRALWIKPTQEESLAARSERTVQGLQEWSGPLTAEQKARVDVLSRELPFFPEKILETRKHWQERLIAILEAGKGERELTELLSQWLKTRQAAPDEEGRKHQAQFEAAVEKLTVGLLALLDTKQRGVLAGKLKGLAEDLGAIVKSDLTIAHLDLDGDQATCRHLRLVSAHSWGSPSGPAAFEPRRCSGSRT